MGLIFKDESSAPADPRAARRRAIFLSAPFVLIGIFALVLFLHDGWLGGLDRHKAFTLLGAMAASIGFVALIFGVNLKKEAMRTSGAKGEADEKPWLKRSDWAAGRITSSSRKAGILLWIFVFFWCAVSAAISLAVVPAQLQRGNHAALIALIFPVIAVGLIYFAWRTTSAWRQFSRSIFEMNGVPAPMGGILKGSIQVHGKLRPEHGWHLALSCLRRTTTGPTNNLRTTEKILWRDEKWLRPDLPQSGSGTVTIPVFFQLPADKPESTPRTGDGIHWRLQAWARLHGPDFDTAFEVPVFKLPETAALPDDPTLPYQLSLDEIRKQIHSKIQIVDLTQGKEFIFPGGRNAAFAAGATILCIIWTIIVALLALKRAPLPLPLVFGAMDVLMLYFVLDLWFRRSRIIISNGTIKIESSWPGFKQENSVKTSDVSAFSAETGAVVGHSAYYDLKLRTRDGKELVLAKNLGHKPEAEWLARQMTAAAQNASNA